MSRREKSIRWDAVASSARNAAPDASAHQRGTVRPRPTHHVGGIVGAYPTVCFGLTLVVATLGTAVVGANVA